MIQHNNYENMNLQQVLNTFSHYQQVNFAFYCAKEVEPFTNDQRVIDCNNVVQCWLKGDKTVDLITSRDNVLYAWNDAYSISCAAYYAVRATYAVVRIAIDYTYHAATFHTAIAKSYHFYPNDETQRNIAYIQFQNEYIQLVQNWLSNWTIPNFPKDEPDFPIFDFLIDMNLISSLLPKKDNLYYLNLNGFDIKHVNETELLKEIDTTHIKNILRRIINNDSAQQL